MEVILSLQLSIDDVPVRAFVAETVTCSWSVVVVVVGEAVLGAAVEAAAAAAVLMR